MSSSSEAAAGGRGRGRPLLVFAVGLLASMGLHAAGLGWANAQKLRPRAGAGPIAFEFFEPAKPTAAPRAVDSPHPRVLPPRTKVVAALPRQSEPPRPAEEVRESPTAPAPLVVGMRLSATAESGVVSVPTGNTPDGPMPRHAPSRAEVEPRGGTKRVPPGTADREPQLASELQIPYPDEARRVGAEGTVRLRIVVDQEGRVVEVKVLSGPGHGLNEAARDAMRQSRFRPATLAGEAVSTSMLYEYKFTLD